MKNANHYLSAILIVLFLLNSCKDSPKDDFSFDDLQKEHIISVNQGLQMYNEFKRNRDSLLQPKLRDLYQDSTFVDTKFVSFSLEDMKAYLAFIDEIQKQNPNYDISGLRVYFAAYPNAKSFRNKDIKNPRQQTIFMAPTVNIGNVDKQYKPLNGLPFYIKGTKANPLKGEFVIIDELMIDYNKSQRLKMHLQNAKSQKASFNVINAMTFREDKIITSTLLNEGQMIPPPTN